jgi:hypothetical protein
VEEEERMIEIHLRNKLPNPSPLNTSNRKDHEIESNALVRSSLRSTPVYRWALIFLAR